MDNECVNCGLPLSDDHESSQCFACDYVEEAEQCANEDR